MINLVISVLAGYWAGIKDQWFQIKEKLANYHLEKKKKVAKKKPAISRFVKISSLLGFFFIKTST